MLSLISTNYLSQGRSSLHQNTNEYLNALGAEDISNSQHLRDIFPGKKYPIGWKPHGFILDGSVADDEDTSLFYQHWYTCRDTGKETRHHAPGLPTIYGQWYVNRALKSLDAESRQLWGCWVLSYRYRPIWRTCLCFTNVNIEFISQKSFWVVLQFW